MPAFRKNGTPLLVGAVFLIVGLAALGLAVRFGMETRAFITGAARADGTVVDLVAGGSGDSSPTYRPTVRFTAADGREITFTSSTGSSPPSHREGDAVRVLYEPGNPEHAAIDEFFELWLLPFIAGIFGVVFPLAGLAAMAFPLRDAILRRRLIANGTRVAAEVQGVESFPAVSGTAFTVVAQATDPRGIRRIFRSAPLATDPGPRMQGRKTVDVIVEPEDYATYEMDLAFLKQ